MTTAECAQRLGVSVQRVRAMLARGQITARKIGTGNRATWIIAVGDDGMPQTNNWRPRCPGRPRKEER
jgi:excisionase family DNA binding protein